jgi:YidC/Oxa1 family membrane protein insertase
VERRVILAIVLMLIVAVLPGILFPSKKAPVRRPGGPADSAVGAATRESVVTSAAPGRAPERRAPPPAAVAPAETVWVTSALYRFGFTSRGARLVWAELPTYRSFAPGDSTAGGHVQLVTPGDAWLTHRLVLGSDTVSLADLDFQPSSPAVHVTDAATSLTFTAERGGATVRLTYRFTPEQYRFQVQGQVSGLEATGAVLLVGLGNGLRSVEADSVDDYRHYAVVTKASKTERKDFSSIDPGAVTVLDGPFEWAGVKSKYFMAAAMAVEEGQPQFAGVVAVGGPRSGKIATHAAVTLTLTVPASGAFQYTLYTGPLEYRRLVAIGHDLADANPYGWSFIRLIVRPVSALVVNILLWMHERLHMAYGWVLILFGLLVRLLLWPLNQKAMASQLRMQAVQPHLKEIQDRYKDNPEKLQKEMMRLYKEHNVNPLGGCLPMLLPWPVLIALFFVFANTIEFRGVPFLWLPDLSRHDPTYIIPIVMGLSMFALSKVGQMGMPPNPQTQMMLYVMPAMMTFLFLRFASGVNLYYAVSNLISIPQQYLLAKRRLREQGRPPSTK